MALYTPNNSQTSATTRFLDFVNNTQGTCLGNYQDLYLWSVANIDTFWSLVWDFTDVTADKGAHVVDSSLPPSSNPPWFLDARINWAENMFHNRYRSAKLAVIQTGNPLVPHPYLLRANSSPVEPTPEFPNPDRITCSYENLYGLVAELVSSLKFHGVQQGQTVGSYCSNCLENLAACLAVTAIGAIWVSAAADFGPQGVLER